MARIRTIKPDFFQSEDVSELPLRARLTWIGLWTHCDDHGRTKDLARLIKGNIWPLDDVSLRDIEDDLQALADQGRIVRYQVDGKPYLAVVNWHVHQSINRPSKARHPAPPTVVWPTDPDESGYCGECASRPTTGTLTEPSLNSHGGLTPGKERKGEEGRGRAHARETPPIPRCEKHRDNTNPPPCGYCKEARTLYELHEATRRLSLVEAPRCEIHGDQPAHACSWCESERKGAA